MNRLDSLRANYYYYLDPVIDNNKSEPMKEASKQKSKPKQKTKPDQTNQTNQKLDQKPDQIKSIQESLYEPAPIPELDVKQRGREKRRYNGKTIKGKRSTSETGHHNIGNSKKGFCSFCFPQLSKKACNIIYNQEMITEYYKSN